MDFGAGGGGCAGDFRERNGEMADDRWDLLNDMEGRGREREAAVGCFGISGESRKKNKRRSGSTCRPRVCVFVCAAFWTLFGAHCQNEGATGLPDFFKFSYELFVFEERV